MPKEVRQESSRQTQTTRKQTKTVNRGELKQLFNNTMKKLDNKRKKIENILGHQEK